MLILRQLSNGRFIVVRKGRDGGFFLVKPRGSRGHVNLGRVIFPGEWLGRRVRFVVEVVLDVPDLLEELDDEGLHEGLVRAKERKREWGVIDKKLGR